MARQMERDDVVAFRDLRVQLQQQQLPRYAPDVPEEPAASSTVVDMVVDPNSKPQSRLDNIADALSKLLPRCVDAFEELQAADFDHHAGG